MPSAARPAATAAIPGPPLDAKRMVDLAGAASGLLLAAPVLLLAAAAVAVETPGPVLFRQPRTGRGGRVFQLVKLRTMHRGVCDPRGARLAAPGDPRITRVGAILRRFHLDELPQLMNVLRGEMSLVGPRPHALHARAGERLYPDAAPGYARRHAVRPGLTGWAQVRGWHGPTPTGRALRGRVACDRAYIARRSLALDLRILLATPAAVLRRS